MENINSTTASSEDNTLPPKTGTTVSIRHYVVIAILMAIAALIAVGFYGYQYYTSSLALLEQRLDTLSKENILLKEHAGIPTSGTEASAAPEKAATSPVSLAQENYLISSIAAVADLREALQNTKPFVQKMAVVAALFKNSPDTASSIAVLESLAERGAPTLFSLQKHFQPMQAKLISTSEQLPDNPSFKQRLAHSLSHIIRVRKLSPKDGALQDMATITQEADAALTNGNVAEAVRIIEQITAEPYKQTAAPWLEEAKLFLDTEDAIHNLYSYVISPAYREQVFTKGIAQ